MMRHSSQGCLSGPWGNHWSGCALEGCRGPQAEAAKMKRELQGMWRTQGVQITSPTPTEKSGQGWRGSH